MARIVSSRGGSARFNGSFVSPHRDSSRARLIQCRQCSEEYPVGTLSCPRCRRLNDRNFLVRSLKALAAFAFIGITAWAVWVAKTTVAPPASDGKPMPKAAPALPGQPDSSQPDLRF